MSHSTKLIKQLLKGNIPCAEKNKRYVQPCA